MAAVALRLVSNLFKTLARHRRPTQRSAPLTSAVAFGCRRA